jgi:hypothetical protein
VKRPARLLILAALFGAILPTASDAVVAFTGTGADLFDDPATSFPTGAPVVVGTALDLPTFVASEVLAVYPLAEALTFGSDDGLLVTYTLTLNRQSDDFDPVFLVTDGIEAVGGQIGDNPDGSARLIEGTLSGDALMVGGDPLIFDGAGFPAVAGTVDAVVEIALRASESEVRVSFLAGDGSAISTRVLDPTAALSLLVVANSALDAEIYRIEEATLEIEVPEPSAPLLLVTGAALLVLRARRRGEG